MLRNLKPSLFLRRALNGSTAFGGIATASTPNGTNSQDRSATFITKCGYASANKDYYKILGVSDNADIKSIKAAYRKRALETHPDQGGNKGEFAEISEAYEVLSNPEKRKIYDQYGSEAATNPNLSNGMGGFNSSRSAEDIFAEFFKGGMGGFGDIFGGGTRANRETPIVKPVEVRLRLSLDEVYRGVTKTIRVTRPQLCSDCGGFGTKSKTEKPKCSQCNGQGHVVQQHRMGPGMIQQSIMECQRCHGTGTLARPEDQCHKCQGKGYRQLAQDVTVNIPAGIPSNVTMIMRGEGGVIPGAQPGDLHVHVEVSPHRVFQRRGDDLIIHKDVTLAEALLGMHMPITLLDERTINVETPANTILKTEGVIKVPGEGMPSSTGGRGDIYIFIQIKMPLKLSPEQRDHIQKAFGMPKAEANASQGNTVKARILRESREQLEEQKRGVWAAQEGGNRGFGGGSSRGGNGRRGGGTREAHSDVEQCATQ